MFKKIDCIRIYVADIDDALAFYQSGLGMELVWRRENSEAGLRMKESDSELVLVSEDLEYPEPDFMVDSVETALQKFTDSGGKVVVPPFEISIGKGSVVEDPWGNRYVILDRSKGLLKVDKDKNVV